jgi:GNAT superfamily N-acetyltransferase
MREELLHATGAVVGRERLPEARHQQVIARLSSAVAAQDRYIWAMWCGDSLAAFTQCASYRPGALTMEASVVAQGHRRRGLYSTLVRTVLTTARDRGYLDVLSSHVASNNPVLIAKLQLGFEVVGTEVSPEFGVVVRLCHPLDPERRALLHMRTGWTPTPG